MWTWPTFHLMMFKWEKIHPCCTATIEDKVIDLVILTSFGIFDDIILLDASFDAFSPILMWEVMRSSLINMSSGDAQVPMPVQYADSPSLQIMS